MIKFNKYEEMRGSQWTWETEWGAYKNQHLPSMQENPPTKNTVTNSDTYQSHTAYQITSITGY